MPPDIAPDQTNIQPKVSQKGLRIVGGVLLFLIVVGGITFFIVRSQNNSITENTDSTAIVPDLTPEQMKQRDEMQARLDAMAKEQGDVIPATPEEMQARLDAMAQEQATSTATTTVIDTPATPEEMRARLDAMAAEQSSN